MTAQPASDAAAPELQRIPLFGTVQRGVAAGGLQASLLSSPLACGKHGLDNGLVVAGVFERECEKLALSHITVQ